MESYIEKSPHDGYILTKLGLLYSRLKRYDKAAGVFEGHTAINTNDPDAHLGLGTPSTMPQPPEFQFSTRLKRNLPLKNRLHITQHYTVFGHQKVLME